MEKKLSVFVKRAIPDFIAHDHPRFYTFIETYFEFLERRDNLSAEFDPGSYWIIDKLIENHDVDNAHEEYLKLIHNELAVDMPINVEGGTFTPYEVQQHRFFLKMMSDFYSVKGTTASFEYFFRTLFNTYFDVYLPKEDMLRVSDGKWEEPFYIRLINRNDTELSDISAEYENLLNSEIKGDTSGSTGFIIEIVDSLPYDTENNIFYDTTVYTSATGTVFNLEQDTFVGAEFIVKVNDIELDSGDYSVSGIPSGVLTLNDSITDAELEITTLGGDLYKYLRIDVADGDFISGEDVVFRKLDGEDSNHFDLEIVDYKIREHDTASNPHLLERKNQGISRPPGNWTNTDGWLNSRKRIQDSYYYQDFSYEIQTDISIADFEEPMFSNVHPAGFLMFNRLAEEQAVQPSFVLDLDGEEDRCLTLVICSEDSPNYNPSVESSEYAITANYEIFGGLDYSTMDRYKDKYNSIMTEWLFEEYDTGTAVFSELEFRLASGNNNHILFLNGNAISDEYIIGEFYHTIYGQFIKFDDVPAEYRTDDVELYLHGIATNRTYYNEYLTGSQNEKAYELVLDQTIDSAQGEDDFLVFYAGKRIPILEVDDVSNIISVSYKTLDELSFTGAESLYVLPFKNGKIEKDTITGDGSAKTFSFTLSSKIRKEEEILVFEGTNVIPDNKYTVTHDTITFSTAIADTVDVDILYFNK